MPVTRWVDGFPYQTFAISALASSPEQTQSTFNYIPPYRGTPRRTQGTGSRGDDELESVTLKLLVPSNHTGQTVSGHPTFYWYVSEVPTETVEFSLVESEVAQPIFVQQIRLQKPGIVRMEMPENLPQLVPGKEYRWSVTLIDNANQPSSDTFAQSWIKRVPETPELKQQLAATKTDRDRASVYAKAGLWYDTISTLIKAQAANPSDSSVHDDFVELLDQAGLTEIAAQEASLARK
jgi:hypothetical protein